MEFCNHGTPSWRCIHAVSEHKSGTNEETGHDKWQTYELVLPLILIIALLSSRSDEVRNTYPFHVCSPISWIPYDPQVSHSYTSCLSKSCCFVLIHKPSWREVCLLANTRCTIWPLGLSLFLFRFKTQINAEISLRWSCCVCFINSLDSPWPECSNRGGGPGGMHHRDWRERSLKDKRAGLWPPRPVSFLIFPCCLSPLSLHFWAGPTSHGIIFSSPATARTCFSRGFFSPYEGCVMISLLVRSRVSGTLCARV